MCPYWEYWSLRSNCPAWEWLEPFYHCRRPHGAFLGLLCTFLYPLHLWKRKRVLAICCRCLNLRSWVNQMWILKNSKELLEQLQSPNFNHITSIKSFDFWNLFTTIPHQKLKSDFHLSSSDRDMSGNVWNRPLGSFMVDVGISSNIMKFPSPKCYKTFWDMTIYSDILNLSAITQLCELITELDITTDFDRIPNFGRFP